MTNIRSVYVDFGEGGVDGGGGGGGWRTKCPKAGKCDGE